MNKRKFPITNIGSVSLLMIFIVLCMVTFAALSLSTAATDYRSAQTLAGHTTAYYKASNKAEKKLARAENILQACYDSSSNADDYYQQARQQLGITDTNGSLIYSFQTSVSKSQELTVQILITYPDSSGTAVSAPAGSDTASAFYKITCWKTSSTNEWNADNSIRLIQ